MGSPQGSRFFESIVAKEIYTQRLSGDNVSGIALMTFDDTTITMGNGKDIAVGASIGTKIGTSATQKLGFFGATPIVQQAGVAVSAAGIHAALVNLGFITA